MSDTPAMSRTLGGADEFERRMRMVGKPATSDEDPLAELARLIGQDDPFKGVIPKSGLAIAPDRAEPTFEPQPSTGYALGGANEDFAATDSDFGDGQEASDDHGAPAEPAEPAVVHGAVGHFSAKGYAPRRIPSFPDDGDDALEQSPDAWAQGADVAVDGLDVRPTVKDSPTTGRTLVVLAAVVVLTSGGLAASFLARPSGMAANASVAPPTILAATGPSKIQPAAAPTGDGGQSEPSTLLDKNKGDGTATAKVVNTVEQPVDLSQAVKPSGDPSSPFPEPRRVKTLVVRPDGTIIANGPDGSAPAAPALDVTDANLAFDARTAIPMPDRGPPPAITATPEESSAAPSSPATPVKTTTRAVTTPRVQPQPAAPVVDGADPAPGAKTRQTTSASVHVRPKSKPIEEASLAAAPDSGAATTGGGGFSVQLGAPPSAQEAHDVSLRLQRKYAEQLGSYRPAIHEGKSGDKSVFRIRVGGLSQDQAKDLCAKLQSGGAACFVARN